MNTAKARILNTVDRQRLTAPDYHCVKTSPSHINTPGGDHAELVLCQMQRLQVQK
jgi:hypothetical protein